MEFVFFLTAEIMPEPGYDIPDYNKILVALKDFREVALMYELPMSYKKIPLERMYCIRRTENHC